MENFKDQFRKNYGYIHHDLSDSEIEEFLVGKENLSIEKQMDLFQDYVLSQGLIDDVQE